jgi:hypothetical protein
MNSLTVTEIIARSIENGCKEIVRKSVMACGSKYGFDGSEACVWLGIDSLKLERKVMRRSKGKKVKKMSLPLPFSKENVNEMGCKGLKYNGGLYTQCENTYNCSSENGTNNRFCNGCEKEGKNNGTGIPDNGCVEDRLKVGLMEFKDPKGRSPKVYSKIMKKLNLSEEEVRREAGNNNYIIDNIHFEKKNKKENKEKEGVESTGKKGRPKKEKKEVEVVKDIFAELVEDTISNVEVAVEKVEVAVEKVEVVEEKVEVVVKKAKKEKKVEFTEEIDEKNKEEEKKAKKANKKLLEEAKAKALKEEEEAKALKKKKEEEEAKAKLLEEEEKAKEEKPQKVTVTRFEFEGKKYLKSSENILYDPETKDEMGIWCEESKSIKELPEEEDDEEMEEEEYDE